MSWLTSICFTKWFRQVRAALLLAAIASGSGQTGWALITGGTGNSPISDPGWPAGAASVFNTPSRVAHWEGPPFGGGQWHAECRGDATAFNRVLKDFAQVEVKNKRVVLHDGIGNSFWLNINREPEQRTQAAIDWVFMVWKPESLKFQQGLPPSMRAVQNSEDVVLTQLDVYTGGGIRWDEVVVPEGLVVIDERLQAHGFSVEDRTVAEGRATDLATQQPLAAKVALERMESAPAGGYRYTPLLTADTNPAGRWVLKQIPPGRFRLVLSADGYVPRVIAYSHSDDEPRWSEHSAGLSKPGQVSGRIVDAQGNPLPEVDVRIDDLVTKEGSRYDVPDEVAKVKTGADGSFRFPSLPLGPATLRVHKKGYVRPGLGQTIEIPAAELKLEMQPAAELRVRVEFSGTKRPEGYLVHVEPEGGEQVGKWSGDGQIDGIGQIIYDNIPAGRYVVTGRPNPGRQEEQTAPMTVELKGSQTTEIILKAR